MKKIQAFTLIETMIAIMVFSIGVLAVLRVLAWDLSLMDHTDMKLQSTVFWKEGLELLYNVRDSNFEKSYHGTVLCDRVFMDNHCEY